MIPTLAPFFFPPGRREHNILKLSKVIFTEHTFSNVPTLNARFFIYLRFHAPNWISKRKFQALCTLKCSRMPCSCARCIDFFRTTVFFQVLLINILWCISLQLTYKCWRVISISTLSGRRLTVASNYVFMCPVSQEGANVYKLWDKERIYGYCAGAWVFGFYEYHNSAAPRM